MLNIGTRLQMSQDFYMAICILLDNFTVLLDNLKFLIDNMTLKKPKTGTTKMKTFCPNIQDSNTVFRYEIRPELRPVKLFTLRSSISYM